MTVGLETAHNLLIDYLWSSGYKNVCGAAECGEQESGSAIVKVVHNDKSDAYVIADLLRTDVHRFYPWSPGSELLQQMRVVSSATILDQRDCGLIQPSARLPVALPSGAA
ncbi:IS110 family transposase [Chloroflexi bacterium TSY]|nr:IS110 family transposase [Chloroflexi bacterium TSY]